MYPPPQDFFHPPKRSHTQTLLLSSNSQQGLGPKQRRENWIFKTHKPSHSEPFSYEYVFEDGKLPMLSERHPPNMAVPAEPTSSLSRRKSQKKQPGHGDRNSAHEEQNSIHSNSSNNSSGGATSRLKRALSFSSLRNHQAHARGTSLEEHHNQHYTHQQARKALPPLPHIPTGDFRTSRVVNDSTATATLSPKPQQQQNVSPRGSPAASTFYFTNPPTNRRQHQTPSPNFSLPRNSSISSRQIRRELTVPRDAVPSVLPPSPTPSFDFQCKGDGLDHSKAPQQASIALGTVMAPLTPPLTPEPPKAVLHHEPQQRHYEQQQHRHQHREEQKPRQTHQEHHTTPPVSSPPIRRKTSRFIEHMDTASTAVPAASTTPALDMTMSGGLGLGLRRSMSARTSSTTTRSFGTAVVCLAEAKPVIAVGSARLVRC